MMTGREENECTKRRKMAKAKRKRRRRRWRKEEL